MGRPSEFDQELADFICERIATSDLGMEQVLEEWRASGKSSVSASTVWRWKEANEEFRNQSARARLMQAELLHDRAQLAATTPLISMTVTDGGKYGRTETTSDNVERSKLIVQTMLKRAGQLDSKKYGEKMQHTGADGEGPVQFVVTRAGSKEKSNG